MKVRDLGEGKLELTGLSEGRAIVTLSAKSPTVSKPALIAIQVEKYPAQPPQPSYAITEGKLPDSTANAFQIEVALGLARLLSFPNNILSVTVSEGKNVKVSAINSRTIAVTGQGSGTARLLIHTSRYAGDTEGKTNLYTVKVSDRISSLRMPSNGSNAQLTPEAITRIFGHPWSPQDGPFEEMLKAEIQKRDQRIKDLEKQLAEKTQ